MIRTCDSQHRKLPDCKMINPRLQIILLILFRDVISTDVNDTLSSEKYRQERVNGRIVKLYSGNKPDPILCFREGFQPDQNDCTIFYRCLKANNEKYTVFRFQCAPGTIYDVEKEICNYPQNTKRTKCGVLPSSTNQRHENDIEDFQHELPKPIIQRDPENNMNLYKPSSQSFYNELSGGYHGSSTSSTLVSQSNEIITDKPQFPINTNEINSQDENRCTTDGFMGDKRNCKKFYRCVNNLRGGFIRYEFLCNDATIWDDSIQGCNHAWEAENSRCGRDNTYNKISHLEFGNKNNVESNKLPIKENPENELNGYNKPNFVQTPSPIDKQTKVNIESSTYYNEPANQMYTSKRPTLSENHPQYGEKIQDNGYSIFNQLTTKSIDNNESNSFADNYRKNICVKNGFFGFADDCKKFYRCVESSKGNYIKYEFSCSDGTVWDNNLKACNFAWAVKDCGSSSSFEDSIVPTTGTYNPSTIYTSSVLTTYSDENTGYGIQNQNKEEMLLTTTSRVNDLLPAVTQESNNIECKENGFYHDENNCQNFYRCVETRRGVFTKFAYQCGEGTLWDPSIEACNHAWAVKNCTVTTFSKTTITTPKVHTPIVTTISLLQTTTQANEIEQDYDTGYNQGPNQFIVSTPKNTNTVINDPLPIKYNKCSKSGFIGDDNDCKKFYRCVDSGNGKFIQYDFSCGEGTVWDPRIESCNHAWAVEKCGGNENNNYSNEIVLPLKPITTTGKISYGTEVYFDSGTTTNPSTSLKPTKMDIKPTSQNSCKEEGYFGNNADCKKFYRCVDHGKATFEMYEYSCGEGTIWDEDIVACNHPQDVKRPSCSMESIISSTTTSSALSSSSFSTTVKSSSLSTTMKENSVHTINNSTKPVLPEQPSITTTTLRVQIENVGQNANKCNEEGFFGDSQDCKNFYRCVSDGKGNYIKYEFTCGEGTMWDQDITACNHPRDVKSPSCSVESSMNSTTISNDASSTSKITTNEVTSTSSPSFTTITSKPTTKDDSTRSTESNVKETSTTERTTEQTLTTSTSKATTTSSKSTTENMKPMGQNTCSEEGYFGNVNDCKSFYRCVYNGKNGFIKYDFTCGEGTIWDQNIIACNHPQDVESPSCSSSSSVDSTTTEKDINSTPTTKSTSMLPTTSTEKDINNTPTTTSTSMIPSTSTTTEGNYEGSEHSGNQQPGEPQEKGNFSCTRPGFYPNPNDCKKFYRCVDWNNDGTSFSIFHFECGEGTIWDPSLDTCNYEDSVYPPRNCSGSSSQTQNNTDTTTSENSTTGSTEETTTTSQQTTVMTTSKQPTSQITTTENVMTTQQSTTVQTTTTTTDQQATTTEKTTTQTGTSSTNQSDLSTTSDTTTTERSTTPMDQTTQTDKTTEESSTSEGTTQPSTTEQQSTSTTDMSTKTTESDKTTTEVTQQTTDSTTSSTPKDKCPDMDDNQYAYVCPTSFRRHPKYCNIFYQCTEDDDSHDLKIALFNCPNNTIYDETKTQCVVENKATKKCDGTLARSNRIKRYSNDYIEPLVVDTDSYACPSVGYFPFERNQECSPALLKCQRSKNNKINGYVFKCPEGYIFWTISKRCERIARVRDCKRSIYPWSKRHEIPNEIRNVAS